MPKVVGYETGQVTCAFCGAINKFFPDELRILKCEKIKSPNARVIKEGFNCANCDKEVITDERYYYYYETPC